MFESVGGKRIGVFFLCRYCGCRSCRSSVSGEYKALYIETLGNPTMRVTDLRKMKEIADKHDLEDWLLTIHFFSPLFQRPIELEQIWLSTVGQNSLRT